MRVTVATISTGTGSWIFSWLSQSVVCFNMPCDFAVKLATLWSTSRLFAIGAHAAGEVRAEQRVLLSAWLAEPVKAIAGWLQRHADPDGGAQLLPLGLHEQCARQFGARLGEVASEQARVVYAPRRDHELTVRERNRAPPEIERASEGAADRWELDALILRPRRRAPCCRERRECSNHGAGRHIASRVSSACRKCTPRQLDVRQGFLDERQFLHQLLEGELALLILLQAQERRRLHRREYIRPERAVHELATRHRDLEVLADHGARRGGAERHDDVRLDRCDLGFEPLAAGVDLALRPRLVKAPPAPPPPFEVLDGVGDAAIV